MAKTEKTEKGSKMESWMNGLKAEFKKMSSSAGSENAGKADGCRCCRFYRTWGNDRASGFYFPVWRRHSGEYQFLKDR